MSANSVLATAAEVAEATRGRLVSGSPQATCSVVSTDSRVPARDSVFVALSGENFDGSRFCEAAVQGGSRILVVSQSAWDAGLAGELGSAAVVAVADSLEALGDLAAWHRNRFPVRVVGITGSNGKTSTKEMTSAVLGGAPRVMYNRGNFNNLVGMPRSLLSLREGHSHAVLEMGMNTPGEIERLARIARPEVGVITNVHPVHLEGLGSIDAVARAKGELLDSLPGDGHAVLNADDPYVLKQAQRTQARKISFGRGPTADVRVLVARHVGGQVEMRLGLGGSEFTVRLARPGAHNAMNAAAAAAVGLVENVPPALIAERLEKAPLPALRMERLQLGEGTLLIDCYNANPRSVQAALSTLEELADGGESFAVLGDMRELGESSEELHWQTGRVVVESGLTGLCAFGPAARSIARGAREGGLAEVCETESVSRAVEWTEQRLRRGGFILLKGSRAMRMERIAESLAGAFGVTWGSAQAEEKE